MFAKFFLQMSLDLLLLYIMTNSGKTSFWISSLLVVALGAGLRGQGEGQLIAVGLTEDGGRLRRRKTFMRMEQ